MEPAELPIFIRPEHFDEMLIMGEVPDVSVQCGGCGVFGDYDNWAGHDKWKLCPRCGYYKGRRLG